MGPIAVVVVIVGIIFLVMCLCDKRTLDIANNIDRKEVSNEDIS